MLYNKKLITDYDLENKKVIIRVDFNVPVNNGFIQDDTRIKESLETIKYALKNNAKIILLSHMGRIKTEEDLAKNDLSIAALKLGELLYKQIKFVNQTKGNEVEEVVNSLKPGEIVLLQNTRYEDLYGNKESNCDEELAKYWAGLGDIFINDAFGVSHRKHASNYGIAKYLPNGIGFLVEKELSTMSPILDNPEKPYFAILGGAKVKDKIGLINSLVNKADYILIGGGMAYTFLKAIGYNVGKSLVDEENLDNVRNILKNYGKKIVLPVDAITGLAVDADTIINTRDIKDIKEDEIGLDIGPKTIELFKKGIAYSKTVIWNGPLGVFEIEEFSKGTKEILSSLIGNRKVIIGGGDTASAAINMGFKDKFTHISTGGGASLEMFAGNNLPGIDIINEK